MDVISTVSHGNKSWQDTYDRAVDLLRDLETLFGRVSPMLVIHELPPIAVRNMYRAESSIVAAAMIQGAASRFGIPVKMVSAQSAKKHLTGNHNANKKLVRDALQARFPAEFKTRSLRITEHGCDALALVVTYLDTLPHDHGVRG
jgi:Holliday junction resolvasome RuvABC endonuclease subunit